MVIKTKAENESRKGEMTICARLSLIMLGFCTAILIASAIQFWTESPVMVKGIYLLACPILAYAFWKLTFSYGKHTDSEYDNQW